MEIKNQESSSMKLQTIYMINLKICLKILSILKQKKVFEPNKSSLKFSNDQIVMESLKGIKTRTNFKI